MSQLTPCNSRFHSCGKLRYLTFTASLNVFVQPGEQSPYMNTESTLYSVNSLPRVSLRSAQHRPPGGCAYSFSLNGRAVASTIANPLSIRKLRSPLPTATNSREYPYTGKPFGRAFTHITQRWTCQYDAETGPTAIK